MQPETLRLIRAPRNHQGRRPGVARLAGIMAAKRTDELDPALPQSAPDVRRSSVSNFPHENELRIEAPCEPRPDRSGDGGLTAVSVAALTIYDMCKSVDRGMTIRASSTGREMGRGQRAFPTSEQ